MKKEASNLSGILHKFIKDYRMEDVFVKNYLQDHWARILNRQLARVSVPVKVENHVLTIKVKDITWKKEFQNRKDLIMDKIKNYLGAEFQLHGIKII